MDTLQDQETSKGEMVAPDPATGRMTDAPAHDAILNSISPEGEAKLLASTKKAAAEEHGLSPESIERLYGDGATATPKPDDRITPMVQALTPKAKEGQQLQGQPLAADVASFPGKVGGAVTSALGIDDAVKALKGEMTPEEQQDMFYQNIPNLMPELKGAGLAALHFMPRALLPNFSTGEKFADLAKDTNRIYDIIHGHGEPGVKSFDLADDAGNRVARLWALRDPENPKQVYINDIAKLDRFGNVMDIDLTAGRGPTQDQQLTGMANSLGTGEMKSLIPKLKDHFPGVEEIGGYRVTGARTGPAASKRTLGEEMSIKIPKSKK